MREGKSREPRNKEMLSCGTASLPALGLAELGSRKKKKKKGSKGRDTREGFSWPEIC